LECQLRVYVNETFSSTQLSEDDVLKERGPWFIALELCKAIARPNIRVLKTCNAPLDGCA